MKTDTMEKILRVIALQVCGGFYAAWLLLRNFAGRVWFRLCYGSFEKQTLRAIKKANKLSAATGYKYYVLQAGCRVTIKPKRLIKNMLACRGKYFKRGTTIQDIERTALYITD